MLVKMFCVACPVTGGRDRFRQCESDSIPQCATEKNGNKAVHSTVALTAGAEVLGLDSCFSQLTSSEV